MGFSSLKQKTRLRVLEDFFDGRLAIVDTAKSVLSESRHSEFDRLLFQDHAGCTLVDHIPERIGDMEQLIDPLSTPVTRVVAVVATLSVVEAFVADLVRAKA